MQLISPHLQKLVNILGLGQALQKVMPKPCPCKPHCSPDTTPFKAILQQTRALDPNIWTTDQTSYIIVTADQQSNQQEIHVGEAKGSMLCDSIRAIYSNLLVIVLMKKAVGRTGQKGIATTVTHSLSKDNQGAEYY